MRRVVSVVLPAYNEAENLETTVRSTIETLESFLPISAFEVIIAEDGCTDSTPAIARRLATEDDRIRHVHSDIRLGRGGALELAFDQAVGDVLVYFDVDLATDLRHLEQLIETVRSEGYDIATGSRHIKGHAASRPVMRSILSHVYNGIVRVVLRSEVHDHQCGFKAFDREALYSILDDVEDSHWFWDTEVLVHAQRHGYRIREFPVEWTPHADTKVDFVRDVVGMGSQIVRAWWQLTIKPRITSRRTLVFGILLTILALGLMTQYLDPYAVFAGIAAADPVLLLIATFVYLVSWPIRGIRYRDILDELDFSMGTWFLTGAVFISQTGNLVVPARAGDAIRAYIVKVRGQVPYPTGFASLAIERVFDLLTITLFAGIVFVTFVLSGFTSIDGFSSALFAPDRDVTISGQVALVVAGGVSGVAITTIVVILASTRLRTDLVRRTVLYLSADAYAAYVANVIEQFIDDIQSVAGNRRCFVRIGASSMLIWGIDAVVAVFVLAAFGVDLSPLILLAVGFFAVSIGNLAKVLPVSPGGIGLYEGAFTLFIVALTPISVSIALGAAIVDHALKNIVTVIGGLSSMVLFNISLKTAINEGQEAADPSLESIDHE